MTRKVFTQKARVCGKHHWALSHPSSTSHLSPDRHRWKECDIWTKEPLTSEKIVAHALSIVFLSKMVPHIPPKGLQMVRPCRSVRSLYQGKCTRRARPSCCYRKCGIGSDPRTNSSLPSRPQVCGLSLPQNGATAALRAPQAQNVVLALVTTRYLALAAQDLCPHWGCIMGLAENWAPKRRFVWMKHS